MTRLGSGSASRTDDAVARAGTTRERRADPEDLADGTVSSVRLIYDAAGHLVRVEDAAQEPSAPLPVLSGASISARQELPNVFNETQRRYIR